MADTNTADMLWTYDFTVNNINGLNVISKYLKPEENDIPAWSLSALLKTLNFPSLTQNKEDEWEVCVFDHDNDDYIEEKASNPIDACYEMVIKLKERNLL